jgi:hypothetical protein
LRAVDISGGLPAIPVYTGAAGTATVAEKTTFERLIQTYGSS